jgi:Tfp pilus assembly protein PilO
LESLLLKAHERSELSHRLCQRASFLLSQFGLNSIKTYGVLQRAYDVRSTYIHGSEIEEVKRKELNDLTKDSVEFARIVLCVFLQLSKKHEKDNLIKKIDNAILDSLVREKLMKTISESVEVFLTD